MKDSYNYSGFCRGAYSSKRKAKNVAEDVASSPVEKISLLDKSCPPYLMQSTAVSTTKTTA